RNLRSWAAYIKIVVGTTLLVFTRRGGGLILSGPMRPPMLEPRAVAQVDRGGMRDIIASLPDQIAAATRASATHFAVDEAQRIFLVGMGGSAIAGDVFAAWVADRSKVPIQVVRDYRLPAYARSEDILVALSYSGNTEETLAATAQGIKLGCRGIAITSGGMLADLAKKNDFSVYDVPTGLPPRGAFGHVPRGRPQRTRRMGRGSACAITSPPPAPRSRRKRADATTARYHRFPDFKEGESRGDPRRWADPREPDARHVVPRGLREPVSGGPASGRSDGAQADRRAEAETRRRASKKLNARGEI